MSSASISKTQPPRPNRLQDSLGETDPGVTEPAVHEYLAAYVMGIANRLAKGASTYYRTHWNIGMPEWRAIMAIGTSTHRIAREVAEMADLDNAAASKSLRLLKEKGLVELEPTARRGGATLVKLTREGLALHRKLKVSAKRRQQRLLSAFTPEESDSLWQLLRKLHRQIPAMNTSNDNSSTAAKVVQSAAAERRNRLKPVDTAVPRKSPGPGRIAKPAKPA
jgi:DNA-binding MarR family transcriptional regulator